MGGSRPKFPIITALLILKQKLLEAVSTRFKTGNGGLGFQIYVGEMKIHPFEWQLCLVAGETYDVVFSGKDGGSADSTTAFV